MDRMFNKTNLRTIICLGDGSATSANLSLSISEQYDVPFNGILDDDTSLTGGVYHTSIYDISPGAFKDKIKDQQVIVLDISYDNIEDYTSTVNLANLASNVEYINPNFENPFVKLMETNKSFCLLPFTSVMQTGNDIRACCHMDGPVTTSISNYDTDPAFTRVRLDMLAGRDVEQCKSCVLAERAGAQSRRKEQTLYNSNKFNIKKPEVKLIDYDIRIGNKCNLRCRMCCPENSNLIDKEYSDIGLSPNKLGVIKSNDLNVINNNNARRVYFAGGEPTINQDVLKFMKKCIDENTVDFDLVFNTNAASATKKFRDLVCHFPNAKYIFSCDNYGDQLNYARNPITWRKLTTTISKLVSTTDTFSWAVTVNIYNIGNLSKLFDWQTSTYPNSNIVMNILSDPNYLQFDVHPDREFINNDLDQCKKLAVYKNDMNFKKNIDYIQKRVNNSTVSEKILTQFFNFNDLLDYSRKDRLEDHFPELEKYRV